MSTPQSLREDVRFLLRKIAFLDGRDMRTLCRSLDLPVLNLGSGEMVEQVRDKVQAALESYTAMPSRETESVLRSFRASILLQSGFLDRYLESVRRAGQE
ncbi:MAG TPA: hypothetical protein VMW83_05250 [Spirochaetia bacterium]|nr:hypothetical protein [Spirochaetia bacterium]